nr:hypothetical protein [Actinomycetospora corticicola]
MRALPKDPDLVRELADRQITLDVGISSNVALGVTPDLALHPLAALVRASVPCSVNADDTLLFGTGLGREYELARGVGLTDDELVAVARASLLGSGAPDPVQDAALAELGG